MLKKLLKKTLHIVEIYESLAKGIEWRQSSFQFFGFFWFYFSRRTKRVRVDCIVNYYSGQDKGCVNMVSTEKKYNNNPLLHLTLTLLYSSSSFPLFTLLYSTLLYLTLLYSTLLNFTEPLLYLTKPPKHLTPSASSTANPIEKKAFEPFQSFIPSQITIEKPHKKPLHILD